MDFEPQSNTLTAASILFGISSLSRLAKAGRKADGDPKVTVGDGIDNGPNNNGVSQPPLSPIDEFLDLTDFRKDHILNGHRNGAGRPGKTEFPRNWNDQRILHQISDVATDPNSIRGLGKWDSPYAIGMRDGIEIRVDFYPDRLPNGNPHPRAGTISTGYPTNVSANPSNGG